jgi:membrane fusion protein (multidrug efflux system)
VKDHSITEQQYEQALAAKQSADKQLQVLIDQRNQIAQQTNIASSQTAASSQQIGVGKFCCKTERSGCRKCKTEFILHGNCSTGRRICRKSADSGRTVFTGRFTIALVKNDQKWVIANFKETQIDKMVEGQKVKIEIDAFPDREFDGVVSSFSPATGATFSILPPDNAVVTS